MFTDVIRYFNACSNIEDNNILSQHHTSHLTLTLAVVSVVLTIHLQFSQWPFGVLASMLSQEASQILLWGWKAKPHFSDLPRGFNPSVFRDSLKLVEIPLAQGASVNCGTVGICAGESFPDLTVADAPILCRYEEGVARSALRKVSVPHVFANASNVRPTQLRDLLEIPGISEFLEVSIALGNFLKAPEVRNRRITAQISALREAQAAVSGTRAQAPLCRAPSLLMHIGSFL